MLPTVHNQGVSDFEEKQFTQISDGKLAASIPELERVTRVVFMPLIQLIYSPENKIPTTLYYLKNETNYIRTSNLQCLLICIICQMNKCRHIYLARL
jgi:uncharacterized protein YybS (DUF2232 family)